MAYIACRRGGGNPGNIKHKITIPFDMADQIDPTGPTPFFRESHLAYGFKVNGESIWIPKSQVDDFHYRDSEHEAHIEFWAPMWLIEAKSIEIFIDTSHEPGLFDA